MSTSDQYYLKMDMRFGVILPAILGILALVLSPFLIEDVFSQEDLIVLQSGIISTASNNYPISNNTPF